MLRWTIRILLVMLLAVLAGTFVISATVAESALHPFVLRRASDTAALAVSTAHAVHAEAQQISLVVDRGVELKAWWIVPPNWNGTAIIACHGVADSGFGVISGALLFTRNGYAVLAPDSRGHGESAGYVTYGVYESKDVVAWSKWLQRHGAARTYGFGESLGGAILIQALGRGAPLRAVVAESSYAYFNQVARERVARYGRVPPWVAQVFVSEALLYVRLKYRIDLATANPADAIRDSSVPVLLIHGLEDKETYPQHSRRLFSNAKCAELWLVPGAGHTGAYAQSPHEFENRVLSFYAAHAN